MNQPETKLGEKWEDKYVCKYCNYSCSIKFSYDRHLLTAKHIKKSQNTIDETQTETQDNTFNCDCGLVYYSRTTLWRHKKKCNVIKNNYNKDDLINYLIKENQEFKNMILDIVKNTTHK